MARCYPKDTHGAVVDYPRIVNEKHFERLCGLMRGESAVIGGEASRARPSIEPTVLDDVSFDEPVMQEEIFSGPCCPSSNTSSWTMLSMKFAAGPLSVLL